MQQKKDVQKKVVNGGHPFRHVRWAPLRGIPLERRLQMLAVSTWIFLLFICLLLFAYLFTMPFLWPVLIAYVTFLYFDKAPESGGRRFDWPRRWVIWRYFVDYFPVKLIKVKIHFAQGRRARALLTLANNRNMTWIQRAIMYLVIIPMALYRWVLLPTLPRKQPVSRSSFRVSYLHCLH